MTTVVPMLLASLAEHTRRAAGPWWLVMMGLALYPWVLAVWASTLLVLRPLRSAKRIEPGRWAGVEGRVRIDEELIPASIPGQPDCVAWRYGTFAHGESRPKSRSCPFLLESSLGVIRIVLNPREWVMPRGPSERVALTTSEEHAYLEDQTAAAFAERDPDTAGEYSAPIVASDRHVVVRPGDDVVVCGYFQPRSMVHSGGAYRSATDAIPTYFVVGNIPRAQRRGWRRLSPFKGEIWLMKGSIASLRTSLGPLNRLFAARCLFGYVVWMLLMSMPASVGAGTWIEDAGLAPFRLLGLLGPP